MKIRRNRIPSVHPSQNLQIAPGHNTARSGRTFKEQRSIVLLTLGGASFLLFAWLASFVYLTTAQAVAIGNRLPWSQWGIKGFGLFALLGILAIPMWLALILASRCQALIIERYFE